MVTTMTDPYSVVHQTIIVERKSKAEAARLSGLGRGKIEDYLAR